MNISRHAHSAAILQPWFLTTLLLLAPCTIAAVPGQMTVALCPPDVAVDAAAFRQDYYSADGTPGTLLILEDASSPSACATTEVAAAEVLWAGLVPADRLDGRLNHMALQGKFSPASIVVSEIIDTTEPDAPPVVVQDNPTQARAASASPPADTQPPQASRAQTKSAWLWSPRLWQQNPAAIWRLQEQQQLHAIYVTVPIATDGTLENGAALTTFVEDATAHGLQVWAVIGDRQDVLAMSRPALQSRLHAYRDYNLAASAGARLAGVQLDIEPYLLPGFSLAQDIWRERYLDALAFAREQLGPDMALDLVVPGWWGTAPAWSGEFLGRLDTTGLSLTVMNYHTTAARLLEVAEPFLAWGQGTNVAVRIALETGRLNDETRRYYGGTDGAGDLWLIDVAGTPVLLLLAAPATGLPGRAFTFADETDVPAATYTFAGDLVRLEAVLAEVSVQWARSPAFAGVALHGLEEALTP